MTTNQLIWLITFMIVTIGTFFMTYMDKRHKKIVKIFSNKIVWIFLTIAILFVISSFFIKDPHYRKAIGLSIVALFTAFFAEIGMLFASFFMTLCFAMAFPRIFE